MIDVGIFENDLIAINKNIPVKIGSIVVARINDEVTVKTLTKISDSQVILRPENSKTSALSLILNFEGIFWFNIFNSKYVDAEKYIDEVSSYILNAYTLKKGEKNA